MQMNLPVLVGEKIFSSQVGSEPFFAVKNSRMMTNQCVVSKQDNDEGYGFVNEDGSPPRWEMHGPLTKPFPVTASALKEVA
eukprot:6194097-Pleurochrysis_carterae.AAC.2